MLQSDALAGRLRDRILNLIHLWGLAPGDRLPGIRELSAETGADHRAVARAYKILEAEGLVEVRGRSGVFAAQGVQSSGDLPHETERWVAAVLAEARKRGISLPALPALVQRLAATDRLRCAFVESTEDQLVAYCWELSHGYGLNVVPIDLRTGSGESWEARLVGINFVVTTPYHAAAVRSVTDSLGIPLAIIAIDPDAVRDVVGILRQRLQQGPLTMIIADPDFAARLRTMYDSIVARDDQIRFVLAHDRAAIAALDPNEAVVLTRAGQARLNTPAPPVCMLHAPLLSQASVRELCTMLVKQNMDSV